MAFKLGVLLIIGAHICATMALSPCACTREFRATCGSDGKTYSNPCTLRCAAFTSGKEITVAKQGACEETTSPQDTCICTYNYSPVCGSDGTTYPNQCSLNCEIRNNPLLKMSHTGACEARQEPGCVCPMLHKPVCGSDGNSYDNKCILNCAAKSNSNLKFVHDGPCDYKVKVAY